MIPYETVLLSQAKTTNNQVYAIDFPHRAFLSKISVSETSGANITPTFDVFSINPTTLAGVDREPPYMVLPTQTLVAGKLTKFIDMHLPYFNHTPLTGRTSPERKIYLRINGNGTGTFDISVSGWSGTP